MKTNNQIKLIDLVSAAKELTPFADPKDIALWMMGELDSSDYETALSQCLPGYVASVVSRQRSRTHIGAPNGGRSRAQESSEYWKQALQELYQGIDANGKAVWKHLYEMNYNDLMYAADVRFTKAQENQAKGEQMLTLAEVVKSYDVDCVDGLPDSIKAAMLTKVVAL